MIKFSDRPTTPAYLTSDIVEARKQIILEQVDRGEGVRSEDFPSYWLNDNVRTTLWRHQKKKCCYCERLRELKRESDVEHFRPKAGITGEDDHLGYWWLAYEWSNFLYACKPCNEAHKKNHFPLMADGVRAWNPDDNLETENPFLINPFDDNPEACIDFDWFDIVKDGEKIQFVKADGRDLQGQGEKTIELTKLNRTDLMEERGSLLLLLHGIAIKMMAGQYLGNDIIIRQAAEDIRRETNARKSFTGFRRAFFRKMRLSEYISND